jgi:hypothetical protein
MKQKKQIIDLSCILEDETIDVEEKGNMIIVVVRRGLTKLVDIDSDNFNPSLYGIITDLELLGTFVDQFENLKTPNCENRLKQILSQLENWGQNNNVLFKMEGKNK